MKRYKFKYRRRFFWKSYTVVGHGYNDPQDKMVLYFEDGSLREIKAWSYCEISLGQDWVAATRKDMEAKVGQAVPLNVG